jgi:two-component system OmpR family response regulator
MIYIYQKDKYISFQQMRILIVEDEPTLKSTIAEGLRESGYQNDEVENITDAEYYLEIRNYDLVILDWMLPNGSGINLIPIIKQKSVKTIVVVLSARGDDKSEIEAFAKGADDYIKKPFDFGILLARIEARLKSKTKELIEIQGLKILPEEERIVYNGEEIELKGKPFEVLIHLVAHRDEIVSKEQLLNAIWKEPELVTQNVIEVAINQIRQKIDKKLGIITVETIRRRGYRFCFPKKNLLPENQENIGAENSENNIEQENSENSNLENSISQNNDVNDLKESSQNHNSSQTAFKSEELKPDSETELKENNNSKKEM